MTLKRPRAARYAEMAMNLSLSKMPWHAQLGAFAALSLAAVGVFWNFYAKPAQASIDAARGAAATMRSRHRARARRRRGGCPEFRREVAEPRGAARAAAPGAARGAGRRRSAAPRPGDGDAVEPDDPRLHAAGGRDAADARGVADRPAARRHVSQPRRVPRAREQVPAHHQRHEHPHQDQKRDGPRPRRSRADCTATTFV